METKMWFVIAVFALLAFVPFAVPGAFAQEENETPDDGAADNETPEDETPDETDEDADDEATAGVTPDSGLHGLDIALDRLRLALAGGPTKAQVGLSIAEERLAELRLMIKQGKGDAAEIAEDAHAEALTETDAAIDALDGVEVDNETVSGIRNGMERHLAAIAKVKARIEASGIPEATKARLLAKFTDLEGRAQELIVKIENRKMLIELRQRFAGLDEKLKIRVSGSLTAEQTALVGQIADSLEQSDASAKIGIKCDGSEANSGRNRGGNRGTGAFVDVRLQQGSDGDNDETDDADETNDDEADEDEADEEDLDENETEDKDEEEVGDEEAEGCEVDVKGTLTGEQQSLVDQLVASLEASGARVKISIESEFEAGEEQEENEAEEQEGEENESEGE